MATQVGNELMQFDNQKLMLRGEPVTMLFFADDPTAPWFKVKPVHNMLGATTVTQTLRRVEPEDKMSLKELVEAKGEPLRGGVLDTTPPDHEDYNEGKAIYVNESGLYTVLLRSEKPEAKKFQRFVTQVVLPQLRRTGSYELPSSRKRPHADDAQIVAKVRRTYAVALQKQVVAMGRVQRKIDELAKNVHELSEENAKLRVVVTQSLPTDVARWFRQSLLPSVSPCLTQWFLQDVAPRLVARMSQTVTFSMTQRLADVRDGVTRAISTPTGALVQALRRAVHAPARRGSPDETKFPQEQLASAQELLECESLMCSLREELRQPYVAPVGAHLAGVELSYGAWKACRRLIGCRALKLRLRDSKLPPEHPQHCRKPLLWAHGQASASPENSGARYVYLRRDAGRYVREVLTQQAPSGSETILRRIRHLIETTSPEEWPLHASEM